MRQKRLHLPRGLVRVLAVLLVGLVFCSALGRLTRGEEKLGAQHLETALRRAAVACYAAEGFYPAQVSYLHTHYGVVLDETRYFIHYEVFADNLMPEITVLEREP